MKDIFPKKQAYWTDGQSGLTHKMEKTGAQLITDLLIHAENFKPLGSNTNAVVGELEHVPQFYHPIFYNNKCFVDHRAFYNKQGRLLYVSEATLSARRGRLDEEWITTEGVFNPIEGFVIDVFSSWVSYGLSAMSACDLRTTTVYRIILAIYYAGLFETQLYHNDHELVSALLTRLPKYLGLPAPTINDVLSVDEELVCELYRNGHTTNHKPHIEMLCHALTRLSNNGLTITAKLLRNSSCGGAIIANVAEQISAIALEHVPTMIAMISISMDRNLATKTKIGKTIAGLRTRHSREIEIFNKIIINLSPEV